MGRIPTVKICLVLIALFSLIGIIISSYQTYKHYAVKESSFCDISSRLDCDTVNRSSYSEIAGVPVAVMGMAGYAVFIALSLLLLKGTDVSRLHRRLMARDLYYLVLMLAAGAFLFSLYLTYLELYVINAVCILCMLSLAIVAMVLLLSIALIVLLPRRKPLRRIV